MLASTSAQGDVAIFRVTEPEAPAPGSSPAYAPAVNLKGGHKDVSHCVHPSHVPLCCERPLSLRSSGCMLHLAIPETSIAYLMLFREVTPAGVRNTHLMHCKALKKSA